MKHWTEITEEEFCIQKLLENPPEKTCDKCGDVSIFWTDDFCGLLCIDCSHEVYCDWVNDHCVHLDQAYK